MDFNKVAMFVEIADAGGVTAAATKLGLPKSSVSRSLTQLEQELGVQLVVRGSRAFHLSDAGRAFLDASSKGIAAIAEARDDIRDESSGPRGLVRISAPPALGTWVLTPVIAAFVRKYPDVRVELSVSSRQADPIRDGFDLVMSLGKLADSSLIARSLGTVDAGVFASAAYLRQRGTPRKPSDLTKHQCVLNRPSGKKARWTLNGPSGAETVAVDGGIRVDDLFTTLAAVLADGGLGILPLHLQRTEPSARDIVRVLPNHIVRGEPLQLVYPASRHVPLRITLLSEAIVEAVATRCPTSGKRLDVA
jgi:DNA-binding transcriptional LysR family regulator